MRTKQLARLLHAPRELDYVEAFQGLQSLNLQIRRDGPSASLLLRKAHLEVMVGNFPAALTAAKDAVALQPQNSDIHFQIGRTFVFLALAKADGIVFGPSMGVLPNESATQLMMKASEAFARALEFNESDEEASDNLDAVEEMLDKYDTERDLLHQLRSSGF